MSNFNFDELNELLTNLESTEGLEKIERKSGSLAQLAEDLAKTKAFSPERKFRLCKPSSNPSLTWNVPQGDIKECPFEVMAVRGVPVAIYQGFSFFDSKTDNTVCRTVAIMPPDGGTVYYNELGPLTQPLYNGVAYQKENTPSRELIRMNPYGSRGFSCIDCIRAGLHQQHHKSKDGSTVQSDKCSGFASIILAVTQLAVAKTDLKEKTRKVEWKDVQEVKDMEGNAIYSGPFLLFFNFRAGSFWYPQDTLVESDLKCWSALYSELNQNNLITDYVKDENVGHLLAPVFLEVWAATPKDKKKYLSPTVKALPGFKIAFPELINTQKMENILSSCYNLYMSEYVSCGGKLENNKLPKKEFKTSAEEEQKALEIHKQKHLLSAAQQADEIIKEEEDDTVIEVKASTIPAIFSRNGN